MTTDQRRSRSLLAAVPVAALGDVARMTRRRRPRLSFLDPALLARIGDLALLARTVVDGFITVCTDRCGRARRRDFARAPAYQPGDDIRRIDWRLFGRTDRYLHEGVRGRHEHQLHRSCSTSRPRWTTVGWPGGRPAIEADVRAATWRPASRTSRVCSATASVWRRSTRTSSITSRRRPSTSASSCTRSTGSSTPHATPSRRPASRHSSRHCKSCPKHSVGEASSC